MFLILHIESVFLFNLNQLSGIQILCRSIKNLSNKPKKKNFNSNSKLIKKSTNLSFAQSMKKKKGLKLVHLCLCRLLSQFHNNKMFVYLVCPTKYFIDDKRVFPIE